MRKYSQYFDVNIFDVRLWSESKVLTTRTRIIGLGREKQMARCTFTMLQYVSLSAGAKQLSSNKVLCILGTVAVVFKWLSIL